MIIIVCIVRLFYKLRPTHIFLPDGVNTQQAFAVFRQFFGIIGIVEIIQLFMIFVHRFRLGVEKPSSSSSGTLQYLKSWYT